MNKLFGFFFSLLILMIFSNISVFAAWDTDFSAFKVGDSENKVATFQFLGEERTLSVSEIKEMLKKQGYGSSFENDEVGSGYTSNVDGAFRAYVEKYTEKLKTAEKELSKQQGS